MTMRVAGQTIAVTSEHPFYTPDRCWVQSNKLKAGDKLLQRDGTTSTVDYITHHKTRTTVYNLTVETDHNFYIGRSNLLVHNCDISQHALDQWPIAVSPASRLRRY